MNTPLIQTIHGLYIGATIADNELGIHILKDVRTNLS
jgi:hypothetical protein